LSFLLLTIMSGLFAKTSLSVCIPWFHKTVISSCSVTGLGMWEYQFSAVSVPNFLHIGYYCYYCWYLVIVVIINTIIIIYVILWKGAQI
jgi:hypothetical protein